MLIIMSGESSHKDIVVGDFGAWDFANIAVRFFAEVGLISLLGELVPL